MVRPSVLFSLLLVFVVGSDSQKQDERRTDDSASRIVNGADAIQGRYPYSVSLQNQDSDFHFCGASLIAPDLVMCAAHCSMSIDDIKAVINPHNVINPNDVTKEEIKFVKRVVHDNYNVGSALANDVMILKLERPATANTPVRLNTDATLPSQEGDPLTVIGWGTTIFGIARPANILQESGITYITNKECEQRYGQSAVDDSMLCALEDNKGACQGDSGGPLLVTGASGDPNDDVQVGIVSWGKDCALKDWPGVYSRVSDLWPWIRETACGMTTDLPDYFDCGDLPRPPTGAPTSTAYPTLTQSELLLKITVDGYPLEFGWKIRRADNDDIVHERLPGYYTKQGGYRERATVDDGGTFYLDLFDERNDGICCVYGEGEVKLFLGGESDPDMLLAYSNGEYGTSESIEFTASEDALIEGPGGGGDDNSPKGAFTVRIRTDLYPVESSWAIETQERQTVYDMAEGVITTVNGDVIQTVELSLGKTYNFVLEDSFGDGICCEHGDGEAAVYYGTTVDENKLIASVSGDFDRRTSTTFVAEEIGGGGNTGEGSCMDDPQDWYDFDGPEYSCAFYATDNNCATYGEMFENFGTTANQACCSCGGGIDLDDSDNPPGTGFGCFPGDATCQVEGQGTVLMKDIKLGDRVLVRDGKYEPVYSFGHFDPRATAEYMQLITQSTRLSLSKEHIVFVEGDRGIPASSVKVGDKLELASGELGMVREIKTIVGRGVYAPFTATGTVIVNGVKSSTFIAYQGSETLAIAGMDTRISFHHLAHAFEAPHRAWCRYISSCKNEEYTKEGISLWVNAPHQAVRWCFAQNSVVAGVVAVPAILCAICVLMYVARFMGDVLVCFLANRRSRFSFHVKSTVQ